jgi:uncharacterized Zn-binding protein involved in type VI secretion
MAHGIAVKALDIAGGAQIAAARRTTWNGHPIVCLGDPVTPHGNGIHNSPVMAEGHHAIKWNGIPVCFQGHLANCGHATTGRPNTTSDTL